MSGNFVERPVIMGDHPLSRKLQIFIMCFEKASRLKDNIDGLLRYVLTELVFVITSVIFKKGVLQ